MRQLKVNPDLTDEMYYEILLDIKKIVDGEGFRPHYHDSDAIGDKNTESNCGFCADEILCTSSDRAIWPELWPERRALRHTAPHQPCPFDSRIHEEGDPNDKFRMERGCFYYCILFQRHIHNVNKLRECVDAVIKLWNENYRKDK